MGTLRCEGCVEELSISHDPAFVDNRLCAERNTRGHVCGKCSDKTKKAALNHFKHLSRELQSLLSQAGKNPPNSFLGRYLPNTFLLLIQLVSHTIVSEILAG